MRAALLALLPMAASIAGCTVPGPGPGPGPRDGGDDCPPIPRGHVAVEVAGGPGPLKQVILVRASHYLPQRSCRGPSPLEGLAAHTNASASGIVDAGTFREVRLVFHDRVVRAQTSLAVPGTGGMLRAAMRDSDVSLTWEGHPLAVNRTEVQPDPFALERQGGSVTFDLDNRTRTFPIVANTSWNLGVFVGYRVRAQEWDETDGYRGPAGSLMVRLLDPNGDPRRQAGVVLPYGHESFGFGPLAGGNWTLAVDTVSEGGPGVAEAEVYWLFDV